ncbi:iron-containing alcohol dehydrogenase, partial [Candidatus Bathyarchaeota archaeon]|nr:iron-containing alcohol dehydrogenase [Candidatus Bathyarchaeota archaeon]
MWFFYSPKIIFGREALEQLGNPLHVQGTRAFIITDKDLVKLGMVELVTKQLENAGMELEVFDGVEPDPPVSMVREAARQCKAFAPDLI